MKIQFGDYLIRSFKLSDVKSMAKYANNYKIFKNLRDYFPYPYSEKEAKDWLNYILSQIPETNFAIATKEELIGAIGFNIQKDVNRYSAEIGYWLAEPFWGKGIAAEALSKLTSFAFSKFELNRIFAGVFEGNTSSMRVLEKAGYKFEARHRKAVYKEGKFLDYFVYSILKEELPDHHEN
jgi:ribosomal-protein-alanine N-acetyltransferase